MKQELQKLEQWGCDVKGTMPRFLEDEAFLMECVEEVAGDPAFETLGEALRQGDLNQAFDAAHMLKGIIANTGLTPLQKIIVEIVEPLRRGESEGLEQSYAQLMEKRNQLLELLKS